MFNNLVINPSVDSIQEFKIQKSMYPAEFGGKASALINVATKSGSNRLNGSLVRVLPERHFRCAQLLRESRAGSPASTASVRRELGGPLIKDSSFFFVSYEGLRLNRSLTRTFSVPDDAVRSGNFSAFAPICDPLTINPSTGACTAFPNNQIPPERIDPIATAFLRSVPRATASDAEFQNLTSVEKLKRDIDQFSVRVDHRLSNRDQVFARFSTFDAE